MLFSFLACDSLTEIVIPETAKKFGLDEYTAVTDIYYTGSNSDWKNIAVTDESNALRNIRIHYNYETPAVDETPIPEHIYNNLVYRTENGNAIITRCTAEYPEEIVIPDTIDGYPVTEIQTDAFYGCTQLKKVTLPANLKKIGNSAFYMCEGLKEIVIPDGTEKIDEFAFYFCSNLTEITIPASVEYIGSDAIATSFGENPEGTQTTVFIYGQSGSAAETYAEEYNLVFVATEPDGSVDPNKLAVNDSSIKVDNKNMLSTFGPDQTTESLKKKIRNSDIEITDKNGNTYSADAFVGTGSKIRIMNNDGSIASEYTVIVPSDVDGNGEITASDARKALRTSAGLEDLTDVYKTAADSDSNDEITASDARKILRLSAGLE